MTICILVSALFAPLRDQPKATLPPIVALSNACSSQSQRFGSVDDGLCGSGSLTAKIGPLLLV